MNVDILWWRKKCWQIIFAAHSCTLYYIMYSNCQGLYSNGDNILRNNLSNIYICWSFSCAIWSMSSFLCMLQIISGQRKETDLLLHSNNIRYSTILKNYQLYYYSKYRSGGDYYWYPGHFSVTRSLGHSVTRSLGHSVTWSLGCHASSTI